METLLAVGLVIAVIVIAIYFTSKKTPPVARESRQTGWLPSPPPLNDWPPKSSANHEYVVSFDGRTETGQQYPFNIVGEASYQANIIKFAVNRGERGAFTELNAVIQHEPNNAYDSNACKVTIENLTVGYLAKNHAKSWLTMLQKQNVPLSAKVYVRATIVGGGKGFESYGVRLDMPERIASVAKYLNKL